MADIIKVLAQDNPAAVTLTDIYIVPTGKSTVISSIVICNRGGGATNFRIAIAVAGIADTPKQYLYYDLPIEGNDTFVATIGVSLSATDVVRVYATINSLSFNVFGVEA